jgi:hypothetical protein
VLLFGLALITFVSSYRLTGSPTHFINQW